MSRSVRSVSIAVCVLLAALGVALAAGPAHAAVPWVTETPLATGPTTQDAPCAYGFGQTLWEEGTEFGWHLWLTVPDPTLLDATAGNQRHPASAGGAIVWEDDRDGTWDIYAGTVTPPPAPAPTVAPSETPVATGLGDQLDPAISGSTVVYEDAPNGNWDIHWFDLSSSTGGAVTTNTADQIDPAISGDSVVYADHRNGNWDIYLTSLSTLKTRRLTTSKADQRCPQISGNWVVYEDHRNGNWDIYAYDLKAGLERRLTTNAHNQTAPQIFTHSFVFETPRGNLVIGNKPHVLVAYQDDRNGSSDIYLYDLATKKERRMTNDPAAQTEPSIGNEEVVWTDGRNGDPDVYKGLFEIPLLSAGGPSGTPAYNSTVKIKGALSGELNSIAGATVGKTGFGGTKRLTTDSLGNFAVSFPNVQRKIGVKFSFGGNAAHLAATPVSLTIKPEALLTRPSLARIRESNGILSWDYRCTGYLKPHHASGSGAVKLRVYAWDWRDSSWVLRSSVTARLHDYGTYSAYQANVSLPNTLNYHKWKVQAVHSDADHAKTLSSFSRVIGA